LAEEDDECKQLVCTADAVDLLVDIAAKHDSADADVLVACAATFYRVSKAQDANDLLVRHGVLEALPVVGAADDIICKALVAATLHSLALSPRHREALVAHPSVLDLMLAIADSSADAADKPLVVAPVGRGSRSTGYAPVVPKSKHSVQALDDAAVATVRLWKPAGPLVRKPAGPVTVMPMTVVDGLRGVDAEARWTTGAGGCFKS
jgi:hypothetical protein